MTDRCDGCRFWDRYDGELSRRLGDCRRRPPAISETLLARRAPGVGQDWSDDVECDVYIASAFPVTHETSWCGEHQPLRDEVIA